MKFCSNEIKFRSRIKIFAVEKQHKLKRNGRYDFFGGNEKGELRVHLFSIFITNTVQNDLLKTPELSALECFQSI